MRCKSLKTCFIVGILAVLLALSLVLWMGCESDIPSKPGAAEETTVYGAPPQNVIDRVMAIQDRHTPRLMAIPGVVGTATGLGADGRPAVLALTVKPGVVGIPGMLDGVPVVVKVTGEIRALPKPPGTPGGGKDKEEEVDPTAWFERPTPIGVSTSVLVEDPSDPPNPKRFAGTIGCRVTKGGNVYALSNNHVYADENRAPLDSPVLQPGTYDGGGEVEGRDDVIGNLFDFEPIDFSGDENTIDAAIAAIKFIDDDVPCVGNATPSDGYGTPKLTTTEAALNMKVKKYGRTTSLSKGQVYAINATVNVGYDSGTALFAGQIVITPGSFSAPGDSGSLIVVDGKGRDKADDRKSVGLLFAGSDLVTIANPIGLVLSRFGVGIDGE